MLKRAKEFFIYALAMTMILTLATAFAPAKTVVAADNGTTEGYVYFYIPINPLSSSRTFNATRTNRPHLMITTTGVEFQSTEAVFQLTGLPAAARVTRIEVFPGTASMAGAMIFPQSWRVRSSNVPLGQTIRPVAVGPVQVFNGLNGTPANGTYFISFSGIGQPIGFPPITTGTMAFYNLRVVIHFQ